MESASSVGKDHLSMESASSVGKDNLSMESASSVGKDQTRGNAMVCTINNNYGQP
jgi:hypothetical protein